MKKKIIIVFLLIAAIQLNAVNAKYIGSQKHYYGAAYYPEAWPESEIDKDIQLM